MAKRRDRRDELLAAAVELARRSGLGALEAAAVAVKAGVSKALVYYYFPTHRDLQAAVVRQAADELLAAVRAAVVLPAPDPGDQLTAGLDAAIGYIEAQPEAFAALSRSAGFHPKLFEVFEYARDGVADVLAEGLGLPDLTARQRIAVRSWIALTEEAVLHWVVAGKPVPREELVAFCQATALAVLASPFATHDAAART